MHRDPVFQQYMERTSTVLNPTVLDANFHFFFLVLFLIRLYCIIAQWTANGERWTVSRCAISYILFFKHLAPLKYPSFH